MAFKSIIVDSEFKTIPKPHQAVIKLENVSEEILKKFIKFLEGEKKVYTPRSAFSKFE